MSVNKKMITSSEVQGLLPLVGLSLVYWWRDRYFFNRSHEVGRVQRIVLVFMYPVWAFLEWTNGLQITRRSWYYIALGTPGRTLIAHYTSSAATKARAPMVERPMGSVSALSRAAAKARAPMESRRAGSVSHSSGAVAKAAVAIWTMGTPCRCARSRHARL